MGPTIKITAVEAPSGFLCAVEVADARGGSHHAVEVSQAELQRYGRGRSVEELVEASFRFLLRREPPSSILPRFRLGQIADYFPEFPAEI